MTEPNLNPFPEKKWERPPISAENYKLEHPEPPKEDPKPDPDEAQKDSKDDDDDDDEEEEERK